MEIIQDAIQSEYCKISGSRTSMQMVHSRKLYLPALIIVTAVLLLLVFVGFSTYWNLDRARANTLRSVHQQGETILNVLEAGIRSVSILPEGHEAVSRLIGKIGKNYSISYIYVVDDAYRILYRSDRLPAEQNGIWRLQFSRPDVVASQIRQYGDGNNIYEIARPLPVVPNARKGAYLVIGLEMDTYEAARHEDFHHAIIMISILFALGAGTVFFIFVIRRYHRTNRQLKETQDYTGQVVDSMANGLLSIDAEGRIISWNQLSLEWLGIRMPEDRLNLGRSIDFKESGITQTLITGKPVIDREISVPLPEGRSLPLAVSVTPFISDLGRCEGAVIILRDLREIKRLEESVRNAEKLAALGKMAAAVAHEIRNPLSSIRGFARFLQHTLKDQEKEREYAAIMVKEVDRVNRVVTDLLNFARPLELETEPTDPISLLSHTIRLVEADAAGRNIDIRIHPETGGERLMIDPNLMTQVLLNLMLNAIQAVEDGGRIDLGAHRSGSHAVFTVEDDGPGIAGENRDRIFDPFFTTHEKGTGLGLAIVRKIIENHQGEIRVESPVPGKNRGCRFVIEIPV